MNAFPIVIPTDCAGYEDGMTLRDYFAGQALAGYLADGVVSEPQHCAEFAYRMADAMLAERGE